MFHYTHTPANRSLKKLAASIFIKVGGGGKTKTKKKKKEKKKKPVLGDSC